MLKYNRIIEILYNKLKNRIKSISQYMNNLKKKIASKNRLHYKLIISDNLHHSTLASHSDYQMLIISYILHTEPQTPKGM